MISQFKLNLIVAYRWSAAVALLWLLIGIAQGQTNITDGTTPPGIAPGAPAGSYLLTEVEVLNVYNGNLSLRFPLYKMLVITQTFARN